MALDRVHYVYSPRATRLLGTCTELLQFSMTSHQTSTAAETRALPHERWTEASLTEIVAAECLASEGPVPASLLPLAMCLQVCLIWLFTSPIHSPS